MVHSNVADSKDQNLFFFFGFVRHTLDSSVCIVWVAAGTVLSDFAQLTFTLRNIVLSKVPGCIKEATQSVKQDGTEAGCTVISQRM